MVFRLKACLLCILSSLILGVPARATMTFTVTNTADTGSGSLRQAILDANGNAGMDQIAFSIPGAGTHTITPLSTLPTITGTVVIDGYTQPGAQANTLATGTNAVLLIELNGNGGSFSGLTVTAGGCTLRGLVINRFAIGIVISGAGNEVSGNYLGVDPSGMLDRGNLFGLSLDNLEGTDNLIGGSSPGQRNVISGNEDHGLRTIGDRTLIQGNYIGTNAAGTAALGNTVAVEVAASHCLVGGANATPGGNCTGPCNLISGNAGTGIIVDNFFIVTQNDVLGNYIGTDVTGQTAIPNLDGVGIGNASSTRIGMALGTAERNVISGNTNRGIYFFRTRTNPTTTLNSVVRNYIGLSSSEGPLGNGGPGIALTDAFANSFTENLIAYNGGSGVMINPGLISPPGGSNRNRIERNSLFANGGPGIDLLIIDGSGSGVMAGVTPNDDGDADQGPNDLQNFPILYSAVSTGGSTQVRGTLRSTPNTAFLINFYANRDCDPSGFGEAEGFITNETVTTDGSGKVDFVFILPVDGPGSAMTATATDPAGSTSEISACRIVDQPRPVANDFDGDGHSDVAIYRPAAGNWYLLGSASGGTTLAWGTAGDIPTTGDFDGDSIADVAVFRPGTGSWYIRRSSAGGLYQSWGESGDVPVPADYDGDGIMDVAVYRPSNGTWYVLRSGGGVLVQPWGQPGDVPIPGDFDGDGRTDFAIYRPAQGWYLAQSNAGGAFVPLGTSGDEPLPADYDGDGRVDPAVFRPSEGNWYLHRSTAGDTVIHWGQNGDVPVTGDYDGDGKSDLAVFRPGVGAWYLLKSTAGEQYVGWGQSTDVPLGRRPH